LWTRPNVPPGVPRTKTNKPGVIAEKKAYTVKNTIVIDETKRITYLGPTVCGAIHDKKTVDEEPLRFPPNSVVCADLGYWGWKISGCRVVLPHKKPQSAVLSDECKAQNAAFARYRVEIEHVHASVKRCRTVKEALRLKDPKSQHDFMFFACALHNFRLQFRTSAFNMAHKYPQFLS
jgi:hypothetical protein